MFLFLVLPFVRFVSILFFSFVSVFFPLVFSMFFSVLSPLFSFGWFLCFSFCLRPLLLLRVCLLPFHFCLFRGGWCNWRRSWCSCVGWPMLLFLFLCVHFMSIPCSCFCSSFSFLSLSLCFLPTFPCGLCLAFIKPENAMRSCLGNGMHRGAAGRRPFFFFSAW